MPYTRIVVTLTGDEAAAVARLQPGADVDAIGALAKIRTALENASGPAGVLLRAKSYQMAKAALPAPPPNPPSAPVARRVPPGYVPYRDEAGGTWK